MARELSCEDKSRNNTNNMVSSGGGFCYSEVSPASNHQNLQTQFTTSQIQDFDDDDHDHHQPNTNTNNNHAEIFNLTTGMDTIGFSKSTANSNGTDHDHDHIQSSSMWKGFNKPLDHHHHHQFTTTTAGISESTSSHDHHQHHQNLIVGPDHHHRQSGPWQENNNIRPFLVDDSSLRCVFPCEGNERPSQGLSLTLSSNNPSSIGLQAFELRHTTSQTQQDGFFGNKPTNIHQQHQMISHEDGFLGNKSLNMSLHQQQQAAQFQLRNSKFLSPAQELLNEFCSLGTKQTDLQKQKSHKSKLQWELDQDSNNNNTTGASSSKKQSLYSLEFLELQKRKSKLLSMLEEVERRYKKYCDQMKAVVSSFEAVAGVGAAAVYSALASKAMSRHFRCLKDGIVSQIQATRKAMGEKDVGAGGGGGMPGSTRGETPRLRILDQALRQQRAFQQMSMMESHPWRPQRGLPERSVSILRAWLFEHFLHPYPSDVDKHILARQTGLSRSQVSNWFINARVRLWKPMVEEMYIEETKEAQLDGTTNNNNNMAAGSSSDGGVDILSIMDPTNGRPTPPGGQNPALSRPDHDQKPTTDQLVRIDSECPSSVVINPEKTDFINMRSTPKTLQPTHHHHNPLMHTQRHQNFGRFSDAFGAMELDFSSYNPHAGHSFSTGSVLYPNDSTITVAAATTNQGFGGVSGGGGGVSLTLGLQQHAAGGGVSHHGVSLAFSPASQSSLFYPRSSSDHHHHHHHDIDHDQDDDDQCQPAVQYSLLDGDDQGQNLPYRNLMGAQLLHDLA